MNAKIRRAQGQKIPYMLVTGQKEADENAVAVRFRDGRQAVMKTDEFVSYIREKAVSRDTEI